MEIPMSHPRTTLGLVVTLLLLAVAAPVTAQLPGTMFGQVFDENGEGIEGVKITITDPEAPNFKQEEVSQKNGRYSIFIRNTLPGYTFEFSKDGFQSFSLNGVKVAARQRQRRNWDMKSASAAVEAAVASGTVDVEAIAKGGAMSTYNQGVAAFNSGDAATAIVAFKDALEKNPDLTQAYAALARAYRKTGNHEGAIEAATMAIEAEIDVADMNQVLFDAYSATGQSAKADEALAKLTSSNPENASKNLFNQAADLFNAGDMDGAKTALTQLLEVNPDHPKGNYMMGMVLAGTDAEKAKAHIKRFLELAPDDPDAETARQMLEYL
jgi:tetratricopeptide (TPR) repeat protein